jgi:hypothetical protein
MLAIREPFWPESPNMKRDGILCSYREIINLHLRIKNNGSYDLADALILSETKGATLWGLNGSGFQTKVLFV